MTPLQRKNQEVGLLNKEIIREDEDDEYIKTDIHDIDDDYHPDQKDHEVKTSSFRQPERERSSSLKKSKTSVESGRQSYVNHPRRSAYKKYLALNLSETYHQERFRDSSKEPRDEVRTDSAKRSQRKSVDNSKRHSVQSKYEGTTKLIQREILLPVKN